MMAIHTTAVVNPAASHPVLPTFQLSDVAVLDGDVPDAVEPEDAVGNGELGNVSLQRPTSRGAYSEGDV